MPRDSVRPPASIVRAAESLISPIAAMRPSLTATSERRGSLPSPSTTVAPRMTRSFMAYLLGLSLAAERAIGGERGMVDEIADDGAHPDDLHRVGETVDHRADHRDAAQALHQARGDVRRMQARHHQHVGRTGQAGE